MQGLIDSVTQNEHITQLFIEGSESTGFWFEVKQVYAPGGKHTRRCTLDSGKPVPTRAEAEAQGKASFAKLTAPATSAATTAETSN